MIHNVRKTIYEIVGQSEDNKTGKIYDGFMIICIISSIMPLCSTEQNILFYFIDKITVTVFIIDYILRLITADYSSDKTGIMPFIIYPLRPMAIVDLLSILPSLTDLSYAFKVFRIIRLFKSVRVFKFFRYSKNIQIIINVLARKKDALIAVGVMALSYIFITALIVFQVEPYTFNNFFHALYWATISLATVGYGDIYPISNLGKMISMVSSLLGVAVVALPSGIIISGFMEEIEKK